jgi:hypothetical protein
VFLNLMENAVKFNEPGGTVAVTAREDAARLEVQVSNSHGTIPPEHIENLLQPFTQGDMGPRRRAGGLGLGLAVAQAVLGAHGGELHLDVGGGQGTTVRVRLPLAPVVQSTADTTRPECDKPRTDNENRSSFPTVVFGCQVVVRHCLPFWRGLMPDVPRLVLVDGSASVYRVPRTPALSNSAESPTPSWALPPCC